MSGHSRLATHWKRLFWHFGMLLLCGHYIIMHITPVIITYKCTMSFRTSSLLLFSVFPANLTDYTLSLSPKPLESCGRINTRSLKISRLIFVREAVVVSYRNSLQTVKKKVRPNCSFVSCVFGCCSVLFSVLFCAVLCCSSNQIDWQIDKLKTKK